MERMHVWKIIAFYTDNKYYIQILHTNDRKNVGKFRHIEICGVCCVFATKPIARALAKFDRHNLNRIAPVFRVGINVWDRNGHGFHLAAAIVVANLNWKLLFIYSLLCSALKRCHWVGGSPEEKPSAIPNEIYCKYQWISKSPAWISSQNPFLCNYQKKKKKFGIKIDCGIWFWPLPWFHVEK